MFLKDYKLFLFCIHVDHKSNIQLHIYGTYDMILEQSFMHIAYNVFQFYNVVIRFGQITKSPPNKGSYCEGTSDAQVEDDTNTTLGQMLKVEFITHL